MFLQVSVISVHRGGCLVPGGAWSWGVPGRGGACFRGGSGPRGGACSQRCLLGGVSGSGGACSGEVWSQGGAWWRPHPPLAPTAAVGTHPTGLHSCLQFFLISLIHFKSVLFTLWKLHNKLTFFECLDSFLLFHQSGKKVGHCFPQKILKCLWIYYSLQVRFRDM